MININQIDFSFFFKRQKMALLQNVLEEVLQLKSHTAIAVYLQNWPEIKFEPEMANQIVVKLISDTSYDIDETINDGWMIDDPSLIVNVFLACMNNEKGERLYNFLKLLSVYKITYAPFLVRYLIEELDKNSTDLYHITEIILEEILLDLESSGVNLLLEPYLVRSLKRFMQPSEIGDLSEINITVLVNRSLSMVQRLVKMSTAVNFSNEPLLMITNIVFNGRVFTHWQYLKFLELILEHTPVNEENRHIFQTFIEKTVGFKLEHNFKKRRSFFQILMKHPVFIDMSKSLTNCFVSPVPRWMFEYHDIFGRLPDRNSVNRWETQKRDCRKLLRLIQMLKESPQYPMVSCNPYAIQNLLELMKLTLPKGALSQLIMFIGHLPSLNQ